MAQGTLNVGVSEAVNEDVLRSNSIPRSHLSFCVIGTCPDFYSSRNPEASSLERLKQRVSNLNDPGHRWGQGNPTENRGLESSLPVREPGFYLLGEAWKDLLGFYQLKNKDTNAGYLQQKKTVRSLLQ